MGILATTTTVAAAVLAVRPVRAIARVQTKDTQKERFLYTQKESWYLEGSCNPDLSWHFQTALRLHFGTCWCSRPCECCPKTVHSTCGAHAATLTQRCGRGRRIDSLLATLYHTNYSAKVIHFSFVWFCFVSFLFYPSFYLYFRSFFSFFSFFARFSSVYLVRCVLRLLEFLVCGYLFFLVVVAKNARIFIPCAFSYCHVNECV